jgi:signal transduction histidine kinase
MAPEVAAHIFEPFFTTKPVGQGTGQGLSIAHATIVNRHAGSIDVRTAPGEGTSITIRIPVAGPPRPQA